MRGPPLALLCTLLAHTALAQSVFLVSMADGGWVGPKSSFACAGPCSEVSGLQVEVRNPGLSYAQTNYVRTIAPYGTVFQLADLQPGGRWSDGGVLVHAALAFVDGGVGPFTAEFRAQPDVDCDQGPGALTVTPQNDGSFRVVAVPAVETKAGLQAHVLTAEQPGTGASVALSVSPGGTFVTSFGPGTWQLVVGAFDLLSNYCYPTVAPTLFTVVSDGGLPPPPPPVPTQAVFTNSFAFIGFDAGALGYHFMSQLDDGGLQAGPFARVEGSATSTGVYVGGCVLNLRTRLSLWLDAGVTPWSGWSTPYAADSVPPGPASQLTASPMAGGVALSWAAAVDSCTGVASYDVVVASDAGAQQQRVTQLSAAVTLPPGDWVASVVAVDQGGLRSSAVSLNFTVLSDAGSGDAGSADAGPDDAGSPDAGPSDAGPSDAGPSDAGSADAAVRDAGGVDAGPALPEPPDAGDMSGPLRVDCGCLATDWRLGVLALSAFWLRRRR